MSDIYYMNTDAISLNNKSPHDIYFEKGMAFTGGPNHYLRLIQKLKPDDLLFMYARGIGVVGIGKVIEKTDGIHYRTERYVYTAENDDEYRIRVNWFLDLRENPLLPSYLINYFGWNPRSAIVRIRRDVEKARLLIEELETNRNF